MSASRDNSSLMAGSAINKNRSSRPRGSSFGNSGRREKPPRSGLACVAPLDPTFRYGATSPRVAFGNDNRRKSRCFPSAWKQSLLKVLVVFLYVFSVHVLCSAISIAIQHRSFATMFKKLGYVCRAFVAAITTHRCIQVRAPSSDELSVLFQKTKFDAMIEQPETIFVKSVIASWCITLTYWVLKTALMVWFFSCEKVSLYFTESFYGFDYERMGLPKSGASVIAVLDWTLNNCTALLSGIHLTELIWNCYTLQKGLNRLLSSMQKLAYRMGSFKSSELQEQQAVYLLLRAQLFVIDCKFSISILLWIAEIVVNVICCVRGISKFLTSSIYEVADETVEIFFYIAIFVVLSYELSLIESKGRRMTWVIGEIATYIPGDDWVLCNQVLLFKTTLTSQRFALSGGNVFVVDRTITMVILAVVVAYSVILLELNSLNNPDIEKEEVATAAEAAAHYGVG